MRKKPARIIKVLVCLIALMFVVSTLGCYLYSFQFNKTYAATYQDKINRLQSLIGKKAVFVGGSSCMFGVHTAQFEKETGIQSVNMAVSAGIPMKFYLDSINPYLYSGDELFLCFEYGYYSYDWNMVGESGLNFLLYQDNSILSKQPLNNLLKSIPDFVTLGWQNWENLVQEYIKNDLLSGYGVYKKDCINVQGDMIAHKDKKSENVPIMAESTTYSDNGTISSLSEYIEELSSRGIDVYFVMQPTMTSMYENNSKSLDYFVGLLGDIEGATVLGSPNDYVYENVDFFDTTEHLSYDAGVIHTDKIISFYENAESCVLDRCQ